MTTTEMPELLKPAEAAALLRTTTNSLQQDRYLHRGAPYIKIGGRVLYDRAELIAYVNANRTVPV